MPAHKSVFTERLRSASTSVLDTVPMGLKAHDTQRGAVTNDEFASVRWATQQLSQFAAGRRSVGGTAE